MTLGGRRIRLPQFAPTVFLDRSTWFWTYGLRAEIALISYDVLAAVPKLLHHPVQESLGFNGTIIVDSGGFGRSEESNALTVYRAQRKLKAQIGVVLDRIPHQAASHVEQQRVLDWNIRNARTIARLRNRTMRIEGVVHGITPKQQAWSARALCGAGVGLFGIPMSSYSKYRLYAQGVDRFLIARNALPGNAVLHALGCGSRTLMALLTYFGADLFDSSGYFRTASYGKKLVPITMCVLGRPTGKPECAMCQERQQSFRTRTQYVRHNLLETLKEATRLRCARENGLLDEYLRNRLKATARRTLEARADLVDPQRRVKFYSSRSRRRPGE